MSFTGGTGMRQLQAERELIGRMQAGDEAAVADMAETYGPRVHQLAFRYLKNWEDAEEVTQDVLLKVHRKIDAFRGDAALSSWIYRITFNAAMSRLREFKQHLPNAMEKASDEESGQPLKREVVDWAPLADEDRLRGEMRQRLIRALTHLPEVYRTPVILRDIHGLSTEEASAVLHVKAQTLKSRLHRGRLIVRQHLSDFAGGLALHTREEAQ